MKITVTIEGMHCPKCAAKVEGALSDKFAIKSATVDLAAKTCTVITDNPLDDESITATIKAVGFTATAITREEEKKGFFKKLFKKS